MKSRLSFLITSLLFITGCSVRNSTMEIPAVSGLNLSRYMGTWYEIARKLHFFEKGMTHVSASYEMLPDGRIRVTNRGIRNGKEEMIRGWARENGNPGTGELEVSFFRPFYGPYRIIYIDPDYALAIVTSSNRDYLWILSRSRNITPGEKEFCLDFLKNTGFSTEDLIWVDQ